MKLSQSIGQAMRRAIQWSVRIVFGTLIAAAIFVAMFGAVLIGLGSVVWRRVHRTSAREATGGVAGAPSLLR